MQIVQASQVLIVLQQAGLIQMVKASPFAQFLLSPERRDREPIADNQMVVIQQLEHPHHLFVMLSVMDSM